MIDDDSKFFSLSGSIPIGGPSTWHITNWDQRRVVSVTMDGEQDDESLAIEHLSRYSDQLSSEIHRIYVSQSGEIISTYTEEKDNQNYCVHYPFLHESSFPAGVLTVRRDELEELSRLGPDVDLVKYPVCSVHSARKVVFKYYFLWQYAHASWKELNLWMRLPAHPNIVPFDRVVVDELYDRVVGFTNIYVPGGNLEENDSRIFRLEWLKQLTEVVDELNLQLGISHQDIAPRNLVINESTNRIMLFDFNFAARISRSHNPTEGEAYREERNDIKGVIFTAYEIITKDNAPRSKPHKEQDLGYLEKEWVKHPDVKLDHPMASYQLLLKEWRDQRTKDLSTAQPGDFPKAIDWPSRPEPPSRTTTHLSVYGEPFVTTMEALYERRQDVRDRNEKVLTWGRPPQRVVDTGIRLLATGKVIEC
ncbi:hypothetical protein B0I35DRAFT_348444 [Stachybotrys elegans]|uniref:EKC/KEOPS complex subunit BUD32 n=1 Tax=Stachybotrys elegans TaxID=80388 RepID=A0A8K0T0M9_9HYPO|nr:hypothetical protein B0I35DRAFT_348444 [Stachybotrys elegans]